MPFLGRLPIPERATVLPARVRKFADRLEAWIYDHADTSSWDLPEEPVDRAPSIVFHCSLGHVEPEAMLRAYAAATRRRRLR